jgi:hypothetical protein
MGARLRTPGWAWGALGVLVLCLLSLWLRSTALHASFWIDEGLSVGISSHPLGDIPSVLRQDGSPPLYYLMLGVWMRVFSDGQATTHVLSLVCALLTIPAAWWAGRSLFGPRSGWFAALLATVNPFLTYYAQETRMYSLVSLLGLLVVALWAHVFAFGHRRYRIAAALALTALVYTHNWGLFLGAGSALALLAIWWRAADRRAVLRDAAVVYGITAALYVPWLPTLAFQAAHTGAPWSEKPTLSDVLGPISGILGGQPVPLALLLTGGSGLAALARRPEREARPAVRATWLLIAVPLAGLALAFVSSQVSPAFTGRYFAVFVGPVLLLAGLGLAHAGRLGLICLIIVLALWLDPKTGSIDHKSDAREVAALIASHVHPGDLVVSVHPEQAPLLHYYFPPGLRYATALGPMADPGVFDWRDALERLRRADAVSTLGQLVNTLTPGRRLVLVLPIISTARWAAPWTRVVRRRSGEWQAAAAHDRYLRRLIVAPRFGHRRLPRGVRAIIYERL